MKQILCGTHLVGGEFSHADTSADVIIILRGVHAWKIVRARKTAEQKRCERKREENKNAKEETNLGETDLAWLHSAGLGRPSRPADPTPFSCLYPAS